MLFAIIQMRCIVKMVTKKLVVFFVALLMFSTLVFSTSREDCFDELSNYYDFDADGIEYSDYQDGFSSYYVLDEPFLRLPFEDPIIYIRFNNVGIESSLKAGDWPTYNEYNFFEIYIDNPNTFDFQFASCGYMKLEPLGDYDFNNLDVSDFKSQDLFSYSFDFDLNKPNFRIFETTYDTIDVNNDPFVGWELLRVLYKQNGLYFQQYNLVDDYKQAFQDYKEGQFDSFSYYKTDIINSGADFAKHLEDYDLYKEVLYDSGISENTEPFEFVVPSPIVYEFALGDKVEVSSIENAIDLLNDQLIELKDYDFISSYSLVSKPVIGELNHLLNINEIQDNLREMFAVIDRSSFFKEIEFNEVEGQTIISKNDLLTIEENLNTYLEKKVCAPGDYVCTTWSLCSGTSSRSVIDNRNCIGVIPPKSVACSWKLDLIGPTYSSDFGCSGTLFRDNTYKDVFNTFIFDSCGIFVTNQWIGHTKIEKTVAGSFDDCGGDDDGGGGN